MLDTCNNRIVFYFVPRRNSARIHSACCRIVAHRRGTFPQCATMKTCNVKNCSRDVVAKGLCKSHYQRLRNFGSVRADVSLVRDRTGKNNPKWRGGKTIAPDGRVLVYSPNHPFPNWKNYVYRYRLVVEASLGRYLRRDEIVHHINGVCNDDRLENLQVMSQSEHIKVERQKLLKGKIK